MSFSSYSLLAKYSILFLSPLTVFLFPSPWERVPVGRERYGKSPQGDRDREGGEVEPTHDG